MKILHIDSSILGDNSVSRTLSADIVKAIKAQNDSAEIIRRNLAETPLGHLSGAHVMASQGHEPESEEIKSDIAAGGAALDEFMSADTIVIGAPMYNFAIPSQLKAWIDRICVAGKTFRYTENGSEGLSGDKKVIVAISRGGFYGEGTALIDFEHQESYLRVVFKFLGISDVTFIRAEGVSLGQEQREKAINDARDVIKDLIAD